MLDNSENGKLRGNQSSQAKMLNMFPTFRNLALNSNFVIASRTHSGTYAINQEHTRRLAASTLWDYATLQGVRLQSST